MARVKKKKRSTGRAKQQEPSGFPRLGFGVRLALLVLATIAMIIFLSWVWHSRFPHTMYNNISVSLITLTQKAGFAVTDISVQGRHYTERDALFKALNIKAGAPILFFDPAQSRASILKLPWVAEVTVLKSLPNKIIIKLEERKPIARWQIDQRTIVIDSHGQEIPDARHEQFSSLPLVVGDDAPEQTRALIANLQRYPVTARLLKAAMWVSKRRWDFYLHPHILVQMPEHNMENALARLDSMIQEDKILERNLKKIDLRLSGRIITEPMSSEPEKE